MTPEVINSLRTFVVDEVEDDGSGKCTRSNYSRRSRR